VGRGGFPHVCRSDGELPRPSVQRPHALLNSRRRTPGWLSSCKPRCRSWLPSWRESALAITLRITATSRVGQIPGIAGFVISTPAMAPPTHTSCSSSASPNSSAARSSWETLGSTGFVAAASLPAEPAPGPVHGRCREAGAGWPAPSLIASLAATARSAAAWASETVRPSSAPRAASVGGAVRLDKKTEDGQAFAYRQGLGDCNARE
jgi:hypothetical protein